MLLIPALNPGPYTGTGNNTWLIDGAEPTLIDAGTGVPGHIDAIEGALPGRHLARVIVTHGHSDHASGVPAITARWPRVELWKFPGEGESGWRTLADGMVIRAGDIDITVIHTPGHAHDHVCLWDSDRRALYAGDMVMSGSSVVIPAGRGGNLRAYLASLDRIAALAPARIYPGHGPVIDRPLELIAAYIQHRRQRESQILECVSRGISDVEGIVAALYEGLPAGLEQAARLTVLAHLEKLREEGRIS